MVRASLNGKLLPCRSCCHLPGGIAWLAEQGPHQQGPRPAGTDGGEQGRSGGGSQGWLGRSVVRRLGGGRASQDQWGPWPAGLCHGRAERQHLSSAAAPASGPQPWRRPHCRAGPCGPEEGAALGWAVSELARSPGSPASLCGGYGYCHPPVHRQHHWAERGLAFPLRSSDPCSTLLFLRSRCILASLWCIFI